MLSGSIAAFLSWALQYGKDMGIEQAADKFPLGLKPHMLAAWGACCIARNAAARAYEKKGRSMLAGGPHDSLLQSHPLSANLRGWLGFFVIHLVVCIGVHTNELGSRYAQDIWCTHNAVV